MGVYKKNPLSEIHSTDFFFCLANQIPNRIGAKIRYKPYVI